MTALARAKRKRSAPAPAAADEQKDPVAQYADWLRRRYMAFLERLLACLWAARKNARMEGLRVPAPR